MMMAQPFPAGQGMPQHGMPPGHHPMSQHPNAGHPGPNMVQGMHPGVSAPGGPQISQAGPMMGGMPPGAGGNVGPGGPMPSSHALSHLNPAQAQVFQQQGFPQNFPTNPHMMQQQQQQHQHQQNVIRQRLMLQQQHQQQHGLPVSLPNGSQGLSPAQMAAMQGNGMRMNPMMQQQQFPNGPPQNLQPQQMFAIQQAQAQAHQAQQAQAQQAQQAQANNAQPGQQTPQRGSAQPPSMHETQTGTPQSQHGPPQSSTPQPTQASQPPSSQPPQQGGGAPAQATPNPQPQQLPQSQQPQQAQQPANQGNQQQQSQPNAQGQQNQPNAQNLQMMAAQEAQMKAQQNAMMMKMQQQQRQGASILALNSYADRIGSFMNKNEAIDIQYWQNFVDTFYAPTGVLRQNLHDAHTGHSKQFEISNPALARFYYTQFTTGIRQIQMVIEGAHESPVNTPGAHLVESRVCLIYWFFNDTQVFTRGHLRVLFDMNIKIESMQIEVQNHCELLPRAVIQSLELGEHKQSPKVSKAAAKRGQKSSPVPDSMVTSHGVPSAVVQFLEVAETMHQMQQLVSFSQANPTLSPPEALRNFVNVLMQNPGPNPGGFPPGMNPAMQAGPRGPGMGPPSQFASPAMAHLGLPGGQGSPHLSGSAHASPAQSQLSGAPGMSGSVQPSPVGVNNSPNVGGNKRRRASTVKQESEDGVGGEVNGTSAPGTGKTKPSPRVPKRQKGAPA